MRHSEIDQLIQGLSRLPGLGPRSGRRLALHLLKHKERVLKPLIDTMKTVERAIVSCTVCHNLDTQNPCFLCVSPQRNETQLCLVEDVSGLWALEKAGIFQGRYHILGGVLSAIDGVGPLQLNLETLKAHLDRGVVHEVILALRATLEGQTTGYYLMDFLRAYPVHLTSLAQGVPVGGELDYLDEGTLMMAFQARHSLDAPLDIPLIKE